MRCSIVILNKDKAVVRTFNWYVTWKSELVISPSTFFLSWRANNRQITNLTTLFNKTADNGTRHRHYLRNAIHVPPGMTLEPTVVGEICFIGRPRKGRDRENSDRGRHRTCLGRRRNSDSRSERNERSRSVVSDSRSDL